MRVALRASYLVIFCFLAPAASAQQTAADFQGATVERFLREAQPLGMKSIGIGVTLPQKATLELDGVRHAAAFKTIDESKPGFTAFHGGGEFNFRDTWHTEIAAYEVDKIIGLGMVPATVERVISGQRGSLQWWVESMMPEAERVKKHVAAPDPEEWNRAMYKTRLFDNLVYNVDRNLNNLLITSSFELRLIDHSRTFRTIGALRAPADLKRFSTSVLEGLKNLEKVDLLRRVGKHLSTFQISALLQRRDAILALARERVAREGEVAVLYP